MEQPRKAILWSVNPFDSQLRTNRREVRAFARWAERLGYSLIAVYVLPTPGDPEGGESGWVMEHSLAAEAAVRRYVAELGLENVISVRVLVSNSSRRQDAILRLTEFAREIDCPWILVSSHGRSGWKRLLQGEFAEGLAAESKCPVLFLTRLPQLLEGDVDRALFVTDFSAASEETFRDFLPTAARLGLEIVVFHQLALDSLSNAGMGNGMQLPDSFAGESKTWAGQKSAHWLELGLGWGVNVTADIASSGSSALLSQAVLEATARNGAKLIVLSSLLGDFASFVSGSASRDILRANAYPVWVYGPKTLASPAVARPERDRPGERDVPA